LTLPLIKTKPTVVTVHDLIPLVFPDKFPVGLRGTLKLQIQKQSLFGAKRIIADSNSSKIDIEKIVGIKSSRIDIVYLAPDPAFHVAKNLASMPKKYILYVGDVNWNKNVLGLLQAFVEVRQQKGLEKYSLVLVGRAFIDGKLPETQEINRFISENHLENCIVRPGNVDMNDLCSIYSGASVYVQPSYYEGFGLPVLEAMKCGSPVVCTNTSSLKEIAGPALQVSPTADSISAGIVKMLGFQKKTQVQKQFDWVKKFTWENVAKETIALYERALV
jgi:alpha-1,3-rhamnosyl/mannosyltransferase